MDLPEEQIMSILLTNQYLILLNNFAENKVPHLFYQQIRWRREYPRTSNPLSFLKAKQQNIRLFKIVRGFSAIIDKYAKFYISIGNNNIGEESWLNRTSKWNQLLVGYDKRSLHRISKERP